MTEQFQTACPQCDTPLRLPDSSIGKRIRCPRCDTRFVTESDDEIPSEIPEADSAADAGEDVEAAAEIVAADDDVQTTEVAADVVAADESANVSKNDETNGGDNDFADDGSTANQRTHVAIAGSGSSNGGASNGEPSNGEAASGDAASGGGVRVPVSGSSSSDRNLLFGVLAWQSGVITQSQLLDAMKQWTFDKDKTLGEILLEQLALAQSQREMLDLLVDTHLQLRRDQTANLRIGSLQAG